MIRKFLFSLIYACLVTLIAGAIVAFISAGILFELLEVDNKYFWVIFIIPSIIFLVSFLNYFEDYIYVKSPKKSKSDPAFVSLSIEDIDKIAIPNAACSHCDSKGLCDCNSCSNNEENYVGKLNNKDLVNYKASDYQHGYYKCSACLGVGAVMNNSIKKYKTIINTDVEDYDLIRKLQEETVERIEKEKVLVELKQKTMLVEIEKRMKLLDKQLDIEKIKFKSSKEKKKSKFSFFR